MNHSQLFIADKQTDQQERAESSSKLEAGEEIQGCSSLKACLQRK